VPTTALRPGGSFETTRVFEVPRQQHEWQELVLTRRLIETKATFNIFVGVYPTMRRDLSGDEFSSQMTPSQFIVLRYIGSAA
jgi:hypothetical protein